MTNMTIIKKEEIKNAVLIPAGIREGADSGNPKIAIKELAPNAQGDLGIWECEPGGWPVTNRQNTEFCYIISGKATLTNDATKETIPVTAGDLIILPIGWSGRWDVEETVRKIYAIY